MKCHAYYQMHPRLRGLRLAKPKSGSVPSFPDGSLSPRQILGSMGFAKGAYASATAVRVGIVSLGGGIVQSDLDNACAWWGMPAPKITVITTDGGANNPMDTDASVEVMLDNQVIASVISDLTGKPADIVNCFAANVGDGIAKAIDALVAAGCSVISISWGQAYDQWDPNDIATTEAALQRADAANVSVFVASGDNSIDDGTSSPTPDYPSASPYTTSVGGVFEALNTDGSIATLQAWGDGQPGDSGGGGGYLAVTSAPAWQGCVVPPPPASLGITGPYLGVPNCSANADPNSGWQGSFGGSPNVVGGTSASAPCVAALVAVAKGVNNMTAGCVNALMYASAQTAFIDVTTGSNGLPSTTGWDPATGCGIPNGGSFIAAISTAAPAPQPGPAPSPSPAPAPTLTLEQAQAALAAGWPSS